MQEDDEVCMIPTCGNDDSFDSEDDLFLSEIASQNSRDLVETAPLSTELTCQSQQTRSSSALSSTRSYRAAKRQRYHENAEEEDGQRSAKRAKRTANINDKPSLRKNERHLTDQPKYSNKFTLILKTMSPK